MNFWRLMLSAIAAVLLSIAYLPLLNKTNSTTSSFFSSNYSFSLSILSFLWLKKKKKLILFHFVFRFLQFIAKKKCITTGWFYCHQCYYFHRWWFSAVCWIHGHSWHSDCRCWKLLFYQGFMTIFFSSIKGWYWLCSFIYLAFLLCLLLLWWNPKA